MQALQIKSYAPLSELRASDVAPTALTAGNVRVAIQAAALNPSDVVSAQGKFPNSPLPRILGRDFAGRVIEGPTALVGKDVWGSGGDLGISRDGTHAEQIVIPESAVSIRPANISAEDASAIGVPFVTAWSALVDAGDVQSGEWVIVSGAAGSVGSAAIEIAIARGAHVVALVLDEKEAAAIDHDKVSAIARSDQNDLAEVVRNATNGADANLALNGVGVAIFDPIREAMANGGRMIVYSSVGGREVKLDLFELYRNQHKLIGINTAFTDASASAHILTQLRPLFEKRLVKPLPVAARYRLSDAAAAYERVAAHTPGKVVLVPDSQFGN